LAANTVNGSGNGARSGAQTLALLAAPLNVAILRALAAGPKQQVELRHETGTPAQTTLRAQLKRLDQVKALEKRRRNRFPGVLEYELSAAGRELLFVADTIERWLGRAPEGPLQLGGNPAKAAIKALAEGWSTTMLRALAANPLSLTELDRVIASLSYPALERRLAALRLAGQVEARAGNGRGTPYAVTGWAREGIGPLAAAARWERRHMPVDTPPIRRIDAEAVFLLTMPLLSLSTEVSGSCRMAMELPGKNGRRLAGAMVAVERGRIESCTSRLQGTPDAWALGSVGAWLEALVQADTDNIEPGGDGRLARALLECLHRALFGTERPVRP
jgi:DNA-binding HxlR family transcriptional regulator